RLTADVKRGADLLRRHQGQRPLPHGVMSVENAGAIDLPSLRFELFEQTAARVEAIECQAVIDALDAEVQLGVGAGTGIRIVAAAALANAGGQRVVGPAKPAGVLSSPIVPLQIAEVIGQVDVARHIPAGPAALIEVFEDR